jgi:cell division protein FtsZ
LSVTIISSLSAEDETDLLQAPPAANASAVSPVREQYQAAAPEPEIQPEEPAVEIQTLEETIAFEEPVAGEADPPVSIEPPVIPTRNGEPERATIKQQEKSVTWKEEKEPIEKSVAPAKQEVLQFEPVTRGRFEKSEPTIIEGEDLDVPTYLRKHIKVK